MTTSYRDWNIQNYMQAHAALPKRPNVHGQYRRRLGYATELLLHGDGTISVIHHATPIVTYFPNLTVEVNTRGYRTQSTKDRVNLFSPISIYQKNWTWYLWDGRPYRDEMRFDSLGNEVED